MIALRTRGLPAGALVHDLDLQPPASGPGFHMVTGVREHDGRLWMGSLVEPAVAVLDLRMVQRTQRFEHG